MSFGKACASFTSNTCILTDARQFVSSFPSTFQRDVTQVQLVLIKNKREHFVKRETNDQLTDLNQPAEIKHLDRDVAGNRHCMLSVALQLYGSSLKHSVLWTDGLSILIFLKFQFISLKKPLTFHKAVTITFCHSCLVPLQMIQVFLWVCCCF